MALSVLNRLFLTKSYVRLDSLIIDYCCGRYVSAGLGHVDVRSTVGTQPAEAVLLGREFNKLCEFIDSITL